MRKPTPSAKTAPKVKPLPEDVLQIIHEQLQHKSGSQLADELGVSTSQVSQAKHDKYVGDLDKFVARVRGQFAGSTAHCPVLGAISTKVCEDQQAMPRVYTNPLRVQIMRACKRCPYAHANRPTTQQPGDSDEV